MNGIRTWEGVAGQEEFWGGRNFGVVGADAGLGFSSPDLTERRQPAADGISISQLSD